MFRVKYWLGVVALGSAAAFFMSGCGAVNDGTLDSGVDADANAGGNKASTGGNRTSTGGNVVTGTGGKSPGTGGDVGTGTGGKDTGDKGTGTGGVVDADAAVPQTNTVGTVGESCMTNGQNGCAGYATRQQLVCVNGAWEANGTCPSGQTCDTRDSNAGYCEPTLAECTGQMGGAHYCDGLDVRECGADLITSTLVESCKVACMEGACATCDPGDMRCNGNTVETCSSSGQWGDAMTCGVSTPFCESATCVSPPSCRDLDKDCGTNSDEDCCTSLLVTGGTFYRSYDGVTYTDQGHPATVDDFYLEKFEVTVGRFRKFKAAWESGWRPSAGDGKHAHLNGGSGLNATSGGYEGGWDTAWKSNVEIADATLKCGGSSLFDSWTPSPGSNETRPLNCLDWYTSYAFCIWDGGFLPSEAEVNYAAAGGAEQRVYPWSSPASDQSIDCTYTNYNNGMLCDASVTANVGSRSPKGDGKYGQSDLAGNLSEWTLDWYISPYPNGSCDNCANLTSSSNRVLRGGSFDQDAAGVLASSRSSYAPADRYIEMGVRCARSR